MDVSQWALSLSIKLLELDALLASPLVRNSTVPNRAQHQPVPKADDIAYAYECAADFLEAEEWPEDDGGAQVAAYREVAKRLRRAAARAAKSLPKTA